MFCAGDWAQDGVTKVSSTSTSIECKTTHLGDFAAMGGKVTTAYQNEMESSYGSADMGSLADADRATKFEEMKGFMSAKVGSLSSTELTDTLSTLKALAQASTNMDSTTATKIVDILAIAKDATTVAAALSGKTAAEKKAAMKNIATQADAAMLAVTTNTLSSQSVGDTATEFTSSSGLKMRVQKKAPSGIAGLSESITSTNVKTATFTLPANLPTAITSLPGVGIQTSASVATFEDPDAVLEPKSDSFSLTFTGNQIY